MGKCYIPTELDKRLAQSDPFLGSPESTSKYFAWMRGLYDETYGDQNWESMEDSDIKAIITKFEGQQKKKEAKEIKAAGTNIASVFVKLQDEIPNASIREARVSWISHMFSDMVTETMKMDLDAAGLEREFIIKGTFDSEGRAIFGQQYIFNQMYRRLVEQRSDAWEQYKTSNEKDLTAKYEAEQIELVLRNWSAMVTLARIRLRDIEGIKMGAFNDFTDTANDGNFELEDLQEKIDIEESSIREGWQEIAESLSAYASIGNEVRAVLANTPQLNEYGAIEKDDLGNTKYLDPVQVHQVLLDAVRGTTSSRGMMRKLRKYTESSYNEFFSKTGDNRRGYWLKPILDKLTLTVRYEDGSSESFDTKQEFLDALAEEEQVLADMILNNKSESEIQEQRNFIQYMRDEAAEASKLQTKFFVDLKRNFQPLYVVQEVISQGMHYLKTFCLNDKKGFNLAATAKSLLYNGRELLISGRNVNTLAKRQEGGSVVLDTEELKTFSNTIFDWFVKGEVTKKEGESKSLIESPTKFMQNVGVSAKTEEDNDRLTRINIIKYIGSKLGFNISTEIANTIATNSRYARRFQSAMQNLYKYSLNHKNLTEQIRSSGGQLSIASFLSIKPSKSISDKGTVEEAIDKLADILAALDKTQEVRVPYVDKKGKNTMLSSDVLPSYLGDLVEKIQEFVEEKDTEGLRLYIEDKYFNNCPMFATRSEDGSKWIIRNTWLRELYESDLSKPGSFAEQFGTFRLLGDSKNTGARRFENYTRKRHAWSMLELFLSPRLIAGEKGVGKNYANYPLFILGDSGVCKNITAKYYSKNTAIKELVGLAKSEVERAKLALEMNQTCSANSWERLETFEDENDQLKFTALPFLNDFLILKKEQTENGTEVHIYKKANKEAGIIEELADDVYIETCIRQSIDNDFEAFYRQLGNDHLLDLNDENNPTYLKNFLTKEEIKTAKDNNKGDIESILKDRIKEFYINYKLATVCQLQMLTIDVGFYKNTEDLQKRYKELHAPGTKLDEEAFDQKQQSFILGDGKEHVIYFDDLSISSDDVGKYHGTATFMDIIKARFGENSNVVKAYKNNTLTDGQGYRTLESYRKVMTAAGKWNNYLENVYDEIQSIRSRMKKENRQELTEEEITRLSQLYVVFQPLKPYLYTIEEVGVSNEHVFKVPVQHKYAEVIIIPELCVPGSNLRALGEAMKENDIDVACSTKCVKVGSFGSIALDFQTNKNGLFIDQNKEVIQGLDKDDNIVDSENVTRSQQRAYIKKYGEGGLIKIDSQSIKDIIYNTKNNGTGAYIHELDYKDYRIQTNVPAHINASNLFGTQIRKIIMTGIDKSGDYSSYLRGVSKDLTVNLGNGKVDLNGNRLIQFYNQLIVANIIESYQDFEKAIDSMDKVSKALIQNVIANSRENEANIVAYCLTGDGQFLVPLYELGIEHNTSQALISLFKKMVNKQKIQGGALVQASAWGITKIEEDSKDYGGLQWHTVGEGENGNIVYGDCEIPFDFKWTDQSGREHQLDFNDYCNPDGTFKTVPGSTINIGGIDVEETLIERDYPGILDIVAYRIPTESQYSMMRLRVKRCSLPTQGGVIRVPAQGTTTAGFDFDIDKLYLMRKQFAFTQYYESEDENLSEEEKNAVWAKIYKDNPSIKTHLEQTKKQWEENPANKGKIHKKSLNSYWDENDYLKSNYNKNEIFSNALSDLINQGEIAPLEKQVKIVRKQNYRYNPNQRVMNSQDENGKFIKGNNRVARNNMLMDLIMRRLEDPETLNERFQPGEFNGAKRSAKIMRILTLSQKSFDDYVVDERELNFRKIEESADNTPDPKPNYDYTDPLTELIYNEQNQVASKLIGIFANQNVNYAISSMLHKYELNSPIAFGNHMDGLKDLIHSPNAKKTCAELLAASVDAVKDPVLNYLNLNETTADAAAVLARLGYSTTEIGLLLNQPIIKELCQISANEGRTTSSALNYLLNDKRFSGFRATGKESQYLNANRLATNIVINSAKNSNNIDTRTIAGNKSEQADFIIGQLSVLKLFQEILDVTREVSEFVTNTKFTASNAVAVSFGSMIAQQYRVKRYLDDLAIRQKEKKNKTTMIITDSSEDSNYFIGMSDINTDSWSYLRSIDFSPFAYEQAMFDMNRKSLNKMCKYFPYKNNLYEGVIQNLADMANYAMDEDTVNGILKDIMVYMMENIPQSRFNKDTLIERNGQIMSQEYYYKYEFPDIILNTSDYEYNQEPIIQTLNLLKENGLISIEPHSETTAMGLTRHWYSIGLKGSANLDFDKKDIIALFENLYKDENTRWFIEDLYMYDYFQNERGFGPKSFTPYLPQIITANLTMTINKATGNRQSYRDWLYSMMNDNFDKIGLQQTKDNIAQFYILRHSDNRRFVKQIYANDNNYNAIKRIIKGNTNYAQKEIQVNTSLIVNNEEVNNPLFISQDKGYVPAFTINIDGIDYLYICDSGSNQGFNKTDDPSIPMTYIRSIPQKVGFSEDRVDKGTLKQGEQLIQNSDLIGQFDDSDIIKPVSYNSLYEKSIIDRMDPTLRDFYETSSEEGKRKILDDIKNKKECYEVKEDGTISKKLC